MRQRTTLIWILLFFTLQSSAAGLSPRLTAGNEPLLEDDFSNPEFSDHWSDPEGKGWYVASGAAVTDRGGYSRLETATYFPETAYALETRARGFGDRIGPAPADSWALVFGRTGFDDEDFYQVVYHTWPEGRLFLQRVFYPNENNEIGMVLLDEAQVDLSPQTWYSFRVNRVAITGKIEVSVFDEQGKELAVLETDDAVHEELGHFGWVLATESPVDFQVDRIAAYALPYDETPAECGPLELVEEDGRTIAVNVQPTDLESGIRSVRFVRLKNAEAYLDGYIDPFQQGQVVPFTPVVPGFRMTAHKTNPDQKSVVVIQVTNGAGLKTTCDPVFQQLSADLPDAFALDQNYPNPFNPTTRIKFQIVEAGNVTLDVFDMMGRRVTSLMDELLEPGTYELEWNGLSESGSAVASGEYIYRLSNGKRNEIRIMTLLR